MGECTLSKGNLLVTPYLLFFLNVVRDKKIVGVKPELDRLAKNHFPFLKSWGVICTGLRLGHVRQLQELAFFFFEAKSVARGVVRDLSPESFAVESKRPPAMPSEKKDLSWTGEAGSYSSQRSPPHSCDTPEYISTISSILKKDRSNHGEPGRVPTPRSLLKTLLASVTNKILGVSGLAATIITTGEVIVLCELCVDLFLRRPPQGCKVARQKSG